MRGQNRGRAQVSDIRMKIGRGKWSSYRHGTVMLPCQGQKIARALPRFDLLMSAARHSALVINYLGWAVASRPISTCLAPMLISRMLPAESPDFMRETQASGSHDIGNSQIL